MSSAPHPTNLTRTTLVTGSGHEVNPSPERPVLRIMPRLSAAVQRFANQVNTLTGWCIVCAAWAALLAWSHRGWMDQDALSYLDMATRAANGHPEDLINAYWSPGYPAIISLALLLFRPAPHNVFSVVHLVNFFVFCGVTLAFAGFWRWGVERAGAVTQNPGQDRSFLAFGFVVFLTLTAEYTGVGNSTPDLMVAGVVFLAASLVWIQARLETWMPSVALGVLLSIGYAVKAALFPVSLCLLAILFAVPPSKQFSRSKVFVAFLVFSIGCMPLIMAVSHRTGQLTFSETGSLNYAWYVDQVKPFWKSGPPDPRVVAQHGPRRLTEAPLLLEFATPFEVTHPLWFDPAYWSAGTKTWFDLRLQMHALEVTGQTYYEELLDMSGLLCGAAVLLRMSRIPNRDLFRRRAPWWQVLWPVAAAGMYAMVHTEGRFLCAFWVLFWLALYRSAIVRSSNRAVNFAVLAIAAGTLLISWTAHLGLTAARVLTDLVHPQLTTEQHLATILEGHLRSGDRLAYMGEGFDVYFARLAQMRVVCQMPDEHAFWSMSAEEMRQLVDRLSALQVKAIVAKTEPGRQNHDSWRAVTISGPRGRDILFLDDLKHKLAGDGAHGS